MNHQCLTTLCNCHPLFLILLSCVYQTNSESKIVIFSLAKGNENTFMEYNLKRTTNIRKYGNKLSVIITNFQTYLMNCDANIISNFVTPSTKYFLKLWQY